MSCSCTLQRRLRNDARRSEDLNNVMEQEQEEEDGEGSRVLVVMAIASNPNKRIDFPFRAGELNFSSSSFSPISFLDLI